MLEKPRIYLILLMCLASLLTIECRPRGIPILNGVKDLDREESKIDHNRLIPLDKLQPPDHLDAVKMEQDGMLNKDFHKEAFLGNHEEIDDDPADMAENKLKDIFHKVDTDADGQLSQAEMEAWIIDKIQEHFDHALEENSEVFKHLDPKNTGFVHWKEYYKHFLLAKGHPIEKAEKHVVDYDVIELNEIERDQLVRYKFRWTDADQPPADNKLTVLEFFAFRHPEQSNITMQNMLSTLFNSLDRNEDMKLTEKEFAALPPGEVEDEEQRKMDEDWQKDRIKEFREVIDKNHDGIATVKELMEYLDPRNPQQAKSEALNLLQIMDEDKNGKISLEEVMKHKDIFITSKIIDIKRNLHDEF